MKTKLAFCLTLAMASTAIAQQHGSMQHGSEHMKNMPMGDAETMQQRHDRHMGQDSAAAKTISTTGTVKKIHQNKNMLTIAHEPVPELEWPAMTMGFKATEEQINQVQEGDKIRFEFTSKGMNNSIVSITKQ